MASSTNMVMIVFLIGSILTNNAVEAGHGGHVKIKVYRGPNHGHKFAPWGYYAHVPADEEGHKHGHKW